MASCGAYGRIEGRKRRWSARERSARVGGAWRGVPARLARVSQSLRRFRLSQVREQLSDFAQVRDGFLSECERNPLYRAEQIAKHGNVVSLRPLEQQRGPALGERSAADLGHFEPRAHRRLNALELAARLELTEKVA